MNTLTEKAVLFRAHATALENVKKLNCWGANIRDVSVLQKMPNVEVLSLSVNSISTLRDFSHCHKLTELYIRKNDIKSIEEIRYLKNLPRLRVLWLNDNDCANVENYRATVLKNIPKLQKLDNIVVSPEEVQKAMQDGTPVMVTEDIPEVPSNLSNEVHSSCTSNQTIESAASVGPLGPKPQSPNKHRGHAASTLEETNKLRAELGIKPLMLSDPKLPLSTGSNTKSSNVLTAVLALIQDMEVDELETVQDRVHERLEQLQHKNNKESSSDKIRKKELEIC